ncbi:hypothetical protein SPBR_02343 [Sporothrix brasiliensis 5110]|uniref:Uncharacterized protein n=1 Tax=Sporothrix brasiliensis 5110 TaxID=1398154 RepID=A0A0C2F025_9PEZI|nr:uncharacterized protein SPBR_02343 [Sporothrix brasiliensis 5110]KIH92129.1 hypothetical protein SPBR_02343 [Sporothrix brasiliensis 5110]
MARNTADAISLTLEPYCILCRRDLPRSTWKHCIGRPLRDNDSEEWESDIIGFFDTAPEDARSGVPTAPVSVHVFRADLRSSKWPPDVRGPTWILKNRDRNRTPEHAAGAQSLHISIATRPSQDATHASPHRALFCVHGCCWKAVRPPDTALPFSRLYRLGQQTRSIMPRPCGDEEYTLALSTLSSPRVAESTGESASSALDVLLAEASKLPGELRAQVARNVHGGLVASLLRALETASFLPYLLPQTDPNIYDDPLLDLHPQNADGRAGVRGHLVARSIRVFGHMYLQRVAFLAKEETQVRSRKRKRTHSEAYTDLDGTSDSRPWDVCIPIRGGISITSVKIWMGPLGVQALTLRYEDWSTSPSLGGVGRPGLDRCVQTLLFDYTATQLVACRDDIKVLCIRSDGVDDTPDLPHHEWPTRSLWNTDETDGPPALDDLVIADTERYPGRLLHHPGRRLCEYLPLQLGDGDTVGTYTSGLTAYCARDGIVGMTAHFGGDGIASSDEQRHIGCHCGVRVHFPLTQGERIIFVALQVCETRHHRADYGPALVLATNMGRHSLFGRIFKSFTRSSTSVVLTENRGNEKKKAVQGLFIDRLTADACCWKSIGVRVDRWSGWDAKSVPPAPVVVTIPYPPSPLRVDESFNRGSAFFSSADLVSASQTDIGVTRLQVCRQGAGPQPRCVGLCIHFDNGRVAILGRWSPTAVVSRKSHSDPDPASTITDLGNNVASCSAITFRFAPDASYVSDIVLGSNAVGPFDVVFSHQELKFIVWWFTERRDLVYAWKPTFLRVTFPDPRGNSFRLRRVRSIDSDRLDD